MTSVASAHPIDAISSGFERHMGSGITVVSVKPIPESHSGFTYHVTAAGLNGDRKDFVLRLAPPRTAPVGPADMLRQARIMSAVGGAGLPVPEVFAAGTGGGDGIDNRAFVIMEFCRGSRVEVTLKNTSSEVVVSAAFDALREIHGLHLHSTGLQDERPVLPGAEVKRWDRLRSRIADGPLTQGMDLLSEQLLALPPPLITASLVHGDYHLGNLLFNQTGRVSAILDWEITQLGHPLMDDAGLCLAAIRRQFAGTSPGGQLDLSLADMLRLRGGEPPYFPWFLAATCHKYSIILAYNLHLHRSGRRIDAAYEQMPETIVGLTRIGLELVR